MGNNVVHFAIHADDVETGDTQNPGIHGALHERAEPLVGTGMRGFSCTVAVDDLADIRSRVLANGGSVQHPEMTIPTVGAHIGFLDTEGNEFAAMVYERPMFGA